MDTAVSVRYAYSRRPGARRRVVHLVTYDRFGTISPTLACGRRDWDTTCNLPLGLKLCKRCEAAWRDSA